MKYTLSWSGGKDSTASVILAHEHSEPLDLIIFCEVMFSDQISGEFPEHIDFVRNKAIPTFERWGYKTVILRADETYLSIFLGYPTKGKRKGLGLRRGFPMVGRCGLNKPCKVRPIERFLKNIPDDFMQYIGIGVDETKRLKRLENAKNKISLLEKYGYTEQMAYDLCKQHDLLSPIYEHTHRGGCWFCPNANQNHLRFLYKSHHDLWSQLSDLEMMPDLIGNKWNTLTGTSIHDLEQKFDKESKEIVIEQT